MFNIEKFLKKTSKNLQQTEKNKKDICDSIEKYTRIKIFEKDVEINNTVVYINTSPSVLNKVFINKKDILRSLLKTSPNLKILDFRKK